jgi:hypothetical protein
MRGWTGRGVQAACLCAAVLLLAGPVIAIPLDPNDGYIWIDDSIGFNIAQDQTVFDRSVGTLGSLVPVNAAAGAGWVNTLYGSYTGPYTFGLELTVPLSSDISMFGTANALFGGGTYSYQLKDLENGGAVLLSGDVIGSFGLLEGFNNVLYTYGGGGGNQGLKLSVTGGSLAPYFAPEAEMFFQYWIASPATLVDFSTDLIAGGGGSVAIYGVPEPVTLLLLMAGGIAVGRSRVGRRQR